MGRVLFSSGGLSAERSIWQVNVEVLKYCVEKHGRRGTASPQPSFPLLSSFEYRYLAAMPGVNWLPLWLCGAKWAKCWAGACTCTSHSDYDATNLNCGSLTISLETNMKRRALRLILTNPVIGPVKSIHVSLICTNIASYSFFRVWLHD